MIPCRGCQLPHFDGLDEPRIVPAISSSRTPAGASGAQNRTFPPALRRHSPAGPQLRQGAGRQGGAERVRGSDASLSGLLGGVRVLLGRAGLLREQGPAERPPALSLLSRGGEARPDGGRTTRISCGHLWHVRRSGHRSVRPQERSAGLLQLVLRQGPRSGSRAGSGLRLTCDRPRATRGRSGGGPASSFASGGDGRRDVARWIPRRIG